MKKVVFGTEITEVVKLKDVVENKFYVGVSRTTKEMFIFRKIVILPSNPPYKWRAICLSDGNDASFTSDAYLSISECIDKFRDDYGTERLDIYEFEKFSDFINWAWANNEIE